MRFGVRALVLVGLGGLLAGCGGGGGGSAAAPTTGGGGVEFPSGPFLTRATGAPKAVVSSGFGTTIAGLYGTTFSLVRFQRPPVATLSRQEARNASVIGYDAFGNPALYVPRTGETVTIPLPTPRFANPAPPVLVPSGDRYVTAEWTDGTREIRSRNLDGTSPTTIQGSVVSRDPDVSPNGARVVYVYGAQIRVASISGANPLTITNETGVPFSPVFTDDGNAVVYVIGNQVKRVNVDGTGGAVVATVASPFVFRCVDVVPGRNAYYALADDGTNGRSVDGVFGRTPSDRPLNRIYNAVAFSPHGTEALLRSSDGKTWMMPGTFADGSTSFPLNPDNYVSGITWSPYAERREFVSTSSSAYANASAGFLYGVKGKAFASFVHFDSPTPASVTVTPEADANPNRPNLTFTVDAPGGLNALLYQNGYYANRQNALVSTTGVNGALVVFDAADGEVVYVLPYGERPTDRSRSGAVRGRFLGVFDRAGKNLAPSGASELRFDPASGRLLGWG